MDLLHERYRGPSSEKIPWIQDPLLGGPHQDLLWRRTGYRVSSLIDRGSCISLCVHGSSACVIILVGLSVSLVFPFVISPRVVRVHRGICSFRERLAI